MFSISYTTRVTVQNTEHSDNPILHAERWVRFTSGENEDAGSGVILTGETWVVSRGISPRNQRFPLSRPANNCTPALIIKAPSIAPPFSVATSWRAFYSVSRRAVYLLRHLLST